MASQLTKTLTLKTLTTSIIPKLSSLSSLHLFSTHKPHLDIYLQSSSTTSTADVAAVVGGSVMQQLEDAIHCIIVRRLEPDWLAFRPGSSYWVPSSRSLAGNLAEIVGKLQNRLSDNEILSLVHSRGWPSESYFIDQDLERVEVTLDSSADSSRWVPSPCDIKTIKHAQLLAKLTNPLTEEESLSLLSAQGWPSSSYFIDQGSTSAAEVHECSQSSEDAPLTHDKE